MSGADSVATSGMSDQEGTAMRAGSGPVLIVFAILASLTAACGVGTGTLRVADAEAEIVAIAEAVAVELDLDVALPLRAAPLEQCTLRAGGAGLRTRVGLRAPLPAGTELAETFDGAAAVMIEQGLVIVESGVPGTLLGQRDGLTVTIGSDGRLLELDAITGCRPR
jgi:hypothetical protein